MAIALIEQFEEGVDLFGFQGQVTEFIDLCGAPHKSIHVKYPVMWS
jgi:hypothetical protein